MSDIQASSTIPTMTIAAAQSGQHSQTYPNSEHVHPPLEKEKIRVVEPSTRTDVNMESVKRFYEMQEDHLSYAQKYYLREELAAKESLVDISV